MDGLIYTDYFYEHLLKGVLHIVETTLCFPTVSWSSGDICSCVAMAMKKGFGPKLTMSHTSSNLAHPEEIPKSVLMQFTTTFVDDPFSKST